jgi:hypothetical protein
MIHTTLRKKLYYWAGAYLALFTLIGFSSGLPAPRAAITMLIAHFASWVKRFETPVPDVSSVGKFPMAVD